MEEGVTFTMGEAIRYGVIQALLEKRMNNADAALALVLSIRQVERIKKSDQKPTQFERAMKELGIGRIFNTAYRRR
jgi:hypothetical protein